MSPWCFPAPITSTRAKDRRGPPERIEFALSRERSSTEAREARSGQRTWKGEIEALRAVHAEVDEHAKLLFCLHALTDHPPTNLGCDAEHAGDNGTFHRVHVDVADEKEVQFDELRHQPDDVLETRETRAGIVYRETHPASPQFVDGSLQWFIDLDGRVLGD